MSKKNKAVETGVKADVVVKSAEDKKVDKIKRSINAYLSTGADPKTVTKVFSHVKDFDVATYLEDRAKTGSRSVTMSTSGKYSSVRGLMKELLKEGIGTYEAVEKVVLKEFPTSGFKKSHYTYYVGLWNWAHS